MAYILRIIFLFLVLTPPSFSQTYGPSPGVCSFPSAILACKAQWSNAKYATVQPSGFYFCANDSVTFGNVYKCEIPPTCTADQVLVNNVCVKKCPAGFKASGNVCVPDGKKLCETMAAVESLAGGLLVKPQVFKGNLEHDSVICTPGGWGDGIPENQGCRMKFDRDMLAGNPDGSQTSYGNLRMQGSASDSGDYSCMAGDGNGGTGDAPKPPAKPDCANGSKGQVNGVDVCIPRQADNGVETGDKKKDIKEDADKKVVTDEEKKTVCKDGKCTTTTTTTTTNKNTNTTTTTTSTNTKEDGKGEFCKENPKSNQCNGTGTANGKDGKDGQNGQNGEGEGGEPSQFGGSCEAGFTCEGDAIQCDIAKEQHAKSCRLFDDESPESTLYEDEKGKEGNQTEDLEGNDTIDMNGKIDQTDILGGGSGVSDLSITVAGTSVVLPFSNINTSLGYLGQLLVAVSMLVAFRIVGRG